MMCKCEGRNSDPQNPWKLGTKEHNCNLITSAGRWKAGTGMGESRKLSSLVDSGESKTLRKVEGKDLHQKLFSATECPYTPTYT